MTFNDFLAAGVSYFFRTEDFSAKYGDGAMMICLLVLTLVCAAAAYFCGCFNSAIFFSKRFFGEDIRKRGSGNAGMTNMFRVFGKKAGILTFAGDVGKAIVAIIAGYCLLGYVGSWLAGLFCMLGHMFPAFYGFRGGKGVLVMFVTMLLCDWPVFVIGILVFIIVLYFGRMVSAASIMTAITMPLFLDIVYRVFYQSEGASGLRFPIALLMTVCVCLAHKSNLGRIFSGTESKIKFPWEKKKENQEKN